MTVHFSLCNAWMSNPKPDRNKIIPKAVLFIVEDHWSSIFLATLM